MTWHHTHPVNIASSLSKFLFLLIIPIARGFFSAILGGFAAWLRGAFWDLLILFLITALGILRWYRYTYAYDDHCFYLRRGILVRSYTVIPYHKIITLSVTSPFYFKPIHAVRLTLDTLAGRKRVSDLNIPMRTKTALDFVQVSRNSISNQYINQEYKPPVILVVLLSMLSSNTFAGILFLATFLYQSGKVFGREFPIILLDTVELLRQRWLRGVEPILALLAIVLLSGWFIAFVISLLRYKDFNTVRNLNYLYIQSGVFTNRYYSIRAQDIAYLDIRQSMVTRLLRLYSVFFYAPGYGKESSALSVLIPMSKKSSFQRTLDQLLPEFQLTVRQIKPNFGSIFKFIVDPFVFLLAIPIAAAPIVYFFPMWYNLVRSLAIMLCFPVLWFLAVRFIDFATTGIGKQGTCYTIRYSRGYYLHTVIVDQSCIASVCIRQSILQKPDDRCDVLIYTKGEGTTKHHCKNLKRKEVEELFYPFVHKSM